MVGSQAHHHDAGRSASIRMKTKIIVAMMALVLPVCALADDPISNLVQKLDAQGAPVWMDGMQPAINLPNTAHPTQVVAFAIQAWAMGSEQNAHSNAIRVVNFAFEGPTLVTKWMATVVDLPKGKKILLFGPMDNNSWWTRFFDTETDRHANKPPAGDRLKAPPEE